MKKNIFDESKCNTHDKLNNFTKYVRRQNIARFLCQTEIFKRQINVKGSIVECGVHHGGGVMAWGQLSAILEPYNYHRHIVGFDTFNGFPSVHKADGGKDNARVGNFSENYDIYEELEMCVDAYDKNRFINEQKKIQLIKGDANKTIPEYVENNQHLLVSLLYLDFDIYEPTVTALRTLLPRIPKGGIIAFDEVNNSQWPGETMALIEELDLGSSRLECFEFEPNISFIQIN
jgi:hypothetical protein